MEPGLPRNVRCPQIAGLACSSMVQPDICESQAGKAAEGGRGLETMRRYEVAWVRHSATGRALPKAFLQADLDFLASSHKSVAEAALLEAEAIKAVTEVYPHCHDTLWTWCS